MRFDLEIEDPAQPESTKEQEALFAVVRTMFFMHQDVIARLHVEDLEGQLLLMVGQLMNLTSWRIRLRRVA